MNARESAVVGVEHPTTGQAIRALVVVSEGAQLTAEALNAGCRDALAAYKLPTQWEIHHEAPPCNASGKVLEPELEHSWAC